MKWKLNSLLKERKDVVRIGKMAETWCRNHMGENNKKTYQICVCYWRCLFEADTDMGEYDPQEHSIFIYYKNIDNVKELLQTIIHEWTHSYIVETPSKDKHTHRRSYIARCGKILNTN